MSAGHREVRTARIHALPEDLPELAAVASREGFRFVGRLLDDWHSGALRFDGPGECLFATTWQGATVAVGGLTRDPYTNGDVGRVRLYVHPDHRGHGIATSLLDGIVRTNTFARLRVRTHAAAAFYEARGFEPLHGDPTATHELT